MTKSNYATISLMALVAACGQGPQQPEKSEAPAAALEPTTPEETEVWEPVPNQVDPFGQNGAPSDAIILFDGSNLDRWISAVDSTAAKWNINADGSMTVANGTGDIQTKDNFGSVQLHLEWRSSPENSASGQAKSNSGVYLQNRYEVQVLDNNDNPTYVNGMVGSLYINTTPKTTKTKTTIPTPLPSTDWWGLCTNSPPHWSWPPCPLGLGTAMTLSITLQNLTTKAI